MNRRKDRKYNQGCIDTNFHDIDTDINMDIGNDTVTRGHETFVSFTLV